VLSQLRCPPAAIPVPRERAFLCVAQDFPRKALLLLLSEWLEFKRRPEAADWSLILKTGPANHTMPCVDFVIRFWRHVQALKRQLGVRQAGVYLWLGDLAPSDYESLLASTFGHIAGGLGEGFCGPVAVALKLGKPVVVPRHTAFADYVPADYPYRYATRPAVVRFLDDPVHVYDPVSRWEIPELFAIADALSRVVLDSPEHRREAGRRARATVRAWCDPKHVRRLVEEELARLAAEETRNGLAAPHVSI
jgi:glycosyltransferase involved in cell wall biosynthesis